MKLRWPFVMKTRLESAEMRIRLQEHLVGEYIARVDSLKRQNRYLRERLRKYGITEPLPTEG